MSTGPRLSPLEIRKLWISLEPDERAAAEARAKAGSTPWKFPGGRRSEAGAVRDRIGRLAGVSGRTVEKVVQVFEAAERDPALFGPVLEYLVRSENVHDAHKRMRRVADFERVRNLAPVEGRFTTLVLDPPWEDDSVSENQRPPYATMSLAEIAAVPVPAWVGEEAHIYCHAPGPWVPTAVSLIQGWGFDFKTILVFRKHVWSMGRYFRTKDEFVAFGTRGGLMVLRQDLPNEFDGAVGEHSEKPDSFYDLVLAASLPPFGEAFQRRPRPDFRNLYAPAAPALEAAE